MRRAPERVYRILNLPAETYTTYSDASRLVTWLIGKKTGHLMVQIVGTKGRVNELQVGDLDPADLLKTLNSLMHNLCQ